MYILAGDDISKISNTINSSVKKYSFQEVNTALNEDNFSEIIANLDTPSLFGERILTVVDITETESELSEKFIEKSKDIKDLYVIYQKKLDSRTKFAKYLISRKALLYELKEEISPFKFGELVVNNQTKEAYEEMKLLQEKGIDNISLFNGILTSCRNILNLKFDTNAKKSIFYSRLSFFQNIASKLSQEDIKKIYSVLGENDLKFKRGEISEEMLILHTMNYILNYGNNK